MHATHNRRTAVRKLTEAKAKLNRWREGCRGPGRIPDRLWMLAAEAAAEVGIEHAAIQLDVNATRLRQWVKRLDQHVTPVETTTPDFIELPPCRSHRPVNVSWKSPNPRDARSKWR
jgi:hypothetical protein